MRYIGKLYAKIAGKYIQLEQDTEYYDNLIKEKLQEYTDFLMKEGYCDSDVVSELPTAIDRFLNPELRDK
jgi:hypothetical protein